MRKEFSTKKCRSWISFSLKQSLRGLPANLQESGLPKISSFFRGTRVHGGCSKLRHRRKQWWLRSK